MAVNVTMAIVISVYLKSFSLHMRNNCVFTQVRESNCFPAAGQQTSC